MTPLRSVKLALLFALLLTVLQPFLLFASKVESEPGICRAAERAKTAEKTGQNIARLPSNKVWELTYQTGNGPIKLWLCPQGAKMSLPENLTILATEPTWHAALYNSKLNSCLDLKANKGGWDNDLSAASYDFTMPGTPCKEYWFGTKSTRRCLPAKEYATNHFCAVLMSNTAIAAKRLELFETDTLDVPPKTLKATAILFAITSNSRSKELPLGMKIVQADGQDMWRYKLMAIKQIDYNPKFFVRPKGMKVAKTIGDVTIDANQQAAMSDIAEQMELGEKFGTHEKKSAGGK